MRVIRTETGLTFEIEVSNEEVVTETFKMAEKHIESIDAMFENDEDLQIVELTY